MSKIFDALRKAELEPSPLAEAAPAGQRPVSRHPRQARLYEQEFGRLGAALQSAFPKTREGRVVLVLGCVEGEGATYVTANLGRVLSPLVGAPLLCMDGNFHDSHLMEELGMAPGPGMSDVYGPDRRGDLSSVIRAGDENHLYALGTGTQRMTPVAFFESPEFDSMLLSLRRTFRFVLVDGPPLLKHPDAIHLAARVDGVVVVVRYRNLKREVIRGGIDMLESIEAPILGAVLNRRKFAIPTLVYKLVS